MSTARDLDRRGFVFVSDPAARTYEALRLEREFNRPSARARCKCGRFVTRAGACARCGGAS